MAYYKDPKTKEDILDRMTRLDFSGDLRTIGENVQLERVKRHVLQLFFPSTGKKFFLTVHKPRPERVAKRATAKRTPKAHIAARSLRKSRRAGARLTH